MLKIPHVEDQPLRFMQRWVGYWYATNYACCYNKKYQPKPSLSKKKMLVCSSRFRNTIAHNIILWIHLQHVGDAHFFTEELWEYSHRMQQWKYPQSSRGAVSENIIIRFQKLPKVIGNLVKGTLIMSMLVPFSQFLIIGWSRLYTVVLAVITVLL